LGGEKKRIGVVVSKRRTRRLRFGRNEETKKRTNFFWTSTSLVTGLLVILLGTGFIKGIARKKKRKCYDYSYWVQLLFGVRLRNPISITLKSINTPWRFISVKCRVKCPLDN
jgi:hypothetical protein